MARWHSCNVLAPGEHSPRLWRFDARNGQFTLEREHVLPPGGTVSPGLAGRDWRSLFQRKLNVAWLSSDKAFLRVLTLPQSDFAETLAMVELQLEKLSPLPVAQVVWSLQVLPHAEARMQTVVVAIVSRAVVEEFVGSLEGQGYQPDRLEVPLLDALVSTPVTGDGAWVYPGGTPDIHGGLVAWWYGGSLQSLGLLNLPDGESRAEALRAQLTRMSWAGELEGWLKSAPAWHLVADKPVADEWLPLLGAAVNRPVKVVAPPSQPELAALTAKRSVQSDARAGLLPAEYAVRYHQDFVDRLWMRGLGAVMAVYILGVLVYFAGLQVLSYKANAEDREVRQLSGSYSNALALKARYQILKDRQELRFAALECWRASAEFMPEDLTLQGLDLKDGRRLTLNGTAPADRVGLVTDFYEALRKATIEGKVLFKRDGGTPPTYRQNPGATTVSWTFVCDLNRAEDLK